MRAIHPLSVQPVVTRILLVKSRDHLRGQGLATLGSHCCEQVTPLADHWLICGLGGGQCIVGSHPSAVFKFPPTSITASTATFDFTLTSPPSVHNASLRKGRGLVAPDIPPPPCTSNNCAHPCPFHPRDKTNNHFHRPASQPNIPFKKPPQHLPSPHLAPSAPHISPAWPRMPRLPQTQA